MDVKKLDHLDNLYRRTSTGPWKADAIANIGENWLIGIINTGVGHDSEAQHIVTTDHVHASEAESEPEADCQWIAEMHNEWPMIARLLFDYYSCKDAEVPNAQ